jgi:hypothetical protein
VESIRKSTICMTGRCSGRPSAAADADRWAAIPPGFVSDTQVWTLPEEAAQVSR